MSLANFEKSPLKISFTYSTTPSQLVGAAPIVAPVNLSAAAILAACS